jgi:hypothetical protein
MKRKIKEHNNTERKKTYCTSLELGFRVHKIKKNGRYE